MQNEEAQIFDVLIIAESSVCCYFNLETLRLR